MKYKQLAMIAIGMMLILSTFSSLTLVSAQEDESDEEGEDERVQFCEEGKTLTKEIQEYTIFEFMPNINNVGVGAVEELTSTLPDVIAAAILTEDTYFSLTDTIEKSKKVTVEGKVYLVELVSASDKYATLKVTNDIGRTETKTVELNSVQYMLDVPFGIINIAEKDSHFSVGIITQSLILSTDVMPKAKVVVADQIYYIELISGSDTSATIKVTCGPALPNNGGGGSGGGGGKNDVFFDGEGFTLTADEGKGYLVDLYIIRDGETIKGSFYRFINKYEKKMPLEGTIDKEGNTVFTVDNEDGFDYVFKGQIKEFDTEQSTDFLVLRGQIKYFENDEPWSLTAFSKEKGDDTEEGVAEEVTCIFHDSEAEQECYTTTGEEQFSCEGIESCVVDVSGEEETKLEWKSTCGGYAYTLMDGKDEKAEFYCGGKLPLPREKKVVFSSSVNEVKTLTPEMKFPTTDTGGSPTLASSGEFDSQNSETAETKEFTVTLKRIESQTTFGIPKFWSEEKRAVVEFNDGEKISTVTINEGEAMQVERYIIEVGDIDNEGKIPIAVSSVIGK